MHPRHLILLITIIALSSIGCATDGKPGPAAGANPPEFKLPPGWTEADMQACADAATPGPQHAKLLEEIGKWNGRNTMWHYPGAEPVTTDATCTVTSFMDGRYTKVEWAGDMPGMGPYNGFGIKGYDNLSQQYVHLWIDNLSTGLMTGTGSLAPDGKTFTWNFPYICPITKKSAVFRQIETITGPKTKNLVMFGHDPKTGQEFKMI